MEDVAVNGWLAKSIRRITSFRLLSSSLPTELSSVAKAFSVQPVSVRLFS
jgi:hypothetical protein